MVGELGTNHFHDPVPAPAKGRAGREQVEQEHWHVGLALDGDTTPGTGGAETRTRDPQSHIRDPQSHVPVPQVREPSWSPARLPSHCDLPDSMWGHRQTPALILTVGSCSAPEVNQDYPGTVIMPPGTIVCSSSGTGGQGWMEAGCRSTSTWGGQENPSSSPTSSSPVLGGQQGGISQCPPSTGTLEAAGQRDGNAGAVGGDPAVERQRSRVPWKLPDKTEEKPKSLLTATLVDLDFFDSYFNRSEKQKAQRPLDQTLEAEHMAPLLSPLTAPWLPRDRLVAREGAGALLQHSDHKHFGGSPQQQRNCPPTTSTRRAHPWFSCHLQRWCCQDPAKHQRHL